MKGSAILIMKKDDKMTSKTNQITENTGYDR